MMLDATIRQATNVWPIVSKILYVPGSEEEFNQLREVMNRIIDQVAIEPVHDENSELDMLLEVIGQLLEDYERAHHPELDEHWPLR